MGQDACDVLFMGEAPTLPRLSRVGDSSNDAPYHLPFQDDGGKVIRNVAAQMQHSSEFAAITTRFIYGVKCAVDNPSRTIISACQTPLKEELLKISRARASARKQTPLVVVACGVRALHSLGIAVAGEKDAAGRVFETVFAGMPLVVVFTLSLKAVAAATGKYSSVTADVERAFRAAIAKSIKVLPREEIEKNYIYPKTITEVRELCEHIHTFSKNGVPALDWSIAFDTETNTLHPHKDGLIVTCVSMAWDRGYSCAIPLWHKDSPYDGAEAFKHVRWLLSTGKRCITHGGKYDLKVLWKLGFDIPNIRWDTLLAEHALEEDKKGQYSLKFLTKQFLPQFAGYEDRLHEMLEEEDTEGENVETEMTKGHVVRVPAQVMEALNRLAFKPTFLAKSAKKQYDALTLFLSTGMADKPLSKLLKSSGLQDEALRAWSAQRIADLQVVINAKTAGEFSGKAAKEKKEKKEQEGGFENVPLPDLLFYAAVDSDATRQLAVLQIGRMAKEDRRIADLRKQIRVEQDFNRNFGQSFPVVELCKTPDPRATLVRDHYLPRQRELAKIEYRGIKIDRDYLRSGYAELDKAVSESQRIVYQLTGEDFKIGSPQQLARFLFNTGVGYIHPDPEKAEKLAADNPGDVVYRNGRIMYKSRHFTEKGAQQTNEPVLKSLQARFEDPLANIVLAFKKATKARNSFWVNVDKLSAHDGFIHPGYNLHGTATGRLSSSSGVKKVGFNNQNIPKGKLGGVKCKKLFTMDDSSDVFVNADAKGAEVTIFGAYSGDPLLMKSLLEGRDTHSFFASKVLSPALITQGLMGNDRRLALANAQIDEDHEWSYEDFAGRDDLRAQGIGSGDPDRKETWERPELVKYADRLKKHRDNIKRVVFGMLFGAGAKKIAEIAGIKPGLAQLIIDMLFKEFPTIKTFMDSTKWELRTFGFVETYDGRLRRFAIKNAPSGLRAQAERRAVNFKIQGQNSDVVLKVLTAIAPVIERDLKGRLLLTVHDSIGFQVPKKYIEDVPKIIYEYGTKRVGETHPWLRGIPFRWDIEAGPNYGELVSIKEYIEKNAPPPDNSYAFEGQTEEEIFDALRDANKDETFKRGTGGAATKAPPLFEE